MKLGFPSEATHWLCEGFNISGRKEMVRTTKVHHRNGCWDEKVARETYWTNIEFVDTACACFTLEYAKPAKQVPCRHARTGVYQLVGLFLYFGDLLTTILSGHSFFVRRLDSLESTVRVLGPPDIVQRTACVGLFFEGVTG